MPVIDNKTKHAKPIDGPWTLTLNHVNGSSDKLELDELIDFVYDSRLITFAGVAFYENRIEIANPDEFTHIDLGIVKGISEVEVNGKSLGLKWYGFHNYALNDSLQKGNNSIKVKVTTLLGNYLKSLEDNPVGQRWINWQKNKSMGMIGPVNLI